MARLTLWCDDTPQDAELWAVLHPHGATYGGSMLRMLILAGMVVHQLRGEPPIRYPFGPRHVGRMLRFTLREDRPLDAYILESWHAMGSPRGWFKAMARFGLEHLREHGWREWTTSRTVHPTRRARAQNAVQEGAAKPAHRHAKGEPKPNLGLTAQPAMEDARLSSFQEGSVIQRHEARDRGEMRGSERPTRETLSKLRGMFL
ncbi:MAG: hypothetical protein K6346_03345 [Halothiobacillaceae bacterium]